MFDPYQHSAYADLMIGATPEPQSPRLRGQLTVRAVADLMAVVGAAITLFKSAPWATLIAAVALGLIALDYVIRALMWIGARIRAAAGRKRLEAQRVEAGRIIGRALDLAIKRLGRSNGVTSNFELFYRHENKQKPRAEPWMRAQTLTRVLETFPRHIPGQALETAGHPIHECISDLVLSLVEVLQSNEWDRTWTHHAGEAAKAINAFNRDYNAIVADYQKALPGFTHLTPLQSRHDVTLLPLPTP